MRTRALLVACLIATSFQVGTAHADDDPNPRPAERLDIPRDPVAIVNALQYEFLNLDPAIEAFHNVAAARGWSLADIAAWTPFVRDVMARESGGCWNTRRGATIDEPQGCVVRRQGRGTDSGFGQVLMSVHGSWLCKQEGLCSPADVIASPWASMTALVALVERSGWSGWCYNAKLRAGKTCKLAPR